MTVNYEMFLSERYRNNVSRYIEYVAHMIGGCDYSEFSRQLGGD